MISPVLPSERPDDEIDCYLLSLMGFFIQASLVLDGLAYRERLAAKEISAPEPQPTFSPEIHELRSGLRNAASQLRRLIELADLKEKKRSIAG